MSSQILDGDQLRQTLSADLSFSLHDRAENVRRTAMLAKQLLAKNTIVLVALITPLQSHRTLAKKILKDYDFIEVFVDTPLAVCIQRDPKGLYQKALAHEIEAFTGISSPYEKPNNPDIHLKHAGSASHLAIIFAYLYQHNLKK